MADDHTLTDDGDGEGIDLAALFEAEAETPAPPPAGRVDITARLSDGTVCRVATGLDDIRLTLAGADGLATAVLAPGDVEILADMIGSGMKDVLKRRRGADW